MNRTPLPRLATRLAPGALVLATLAACGGGGGDSPAPTTPATVPTTPLTLSASNADTAAARGYEAATGLFDASGSAAGQLKSTAGASVFDPTRFVLAHLRTRADAASGGATGKAVQTLSDACPGGGGIRVTAEDRNGNGQTDAGDSASFTFTDCVSDGVRVSGSMAFAFQSYSSTAAADTVAVTVTFSALTAVDASGAATLSGDMTLSARIAKVAPLTSDVTLSGTSLTATEGGQTRTITGYSGRVTLDDTAGTYSYTVSGTASGTGIDGYLAVSTPTPIAGRQGATPTAGVLLLSGANQGAVRITVDAPTGVRVDLDANGDGAVDSTKSLTWAQFDAL